MFWSKKTKPATRPVQPACHAPLAISLEPRMLFDGAVAATVADAGFPAADATQTVEDGSQQISDAAPPAATSDQRQEVVFIDGSVGDKQQLLDSLAPGAEVIVLDSTRDGLTQMAEYLNGRSGIDAIHLISHGSEASFQVGSMRLNLSNISDVQAELVAIGSSLNADADLLIYGCDIAKGEDGTALIEQLGILTGADVAASTNWTGNSSNGGDWVLEASTGAIESDALFADASYGHVLNTLNAGDIVVLGWNAADDTITFATLVDIPAGTVIKITDKGWDQATNAFTTSSTGDGTVTWTTSGAISAGNIFRLFLEGSDGPPTATLTNVTTSADLTADILTEGFTVTDPMNLVGDSIFIYQDADSNPYFIFGVNNSAGTVDANGWNTSIAATLRDSMTPNGSGSQNSLVNGTNAVGLPGGGSQQDNVQYTGATTTTDRATWLARIADRANWSGDNTGTTTTSVGIVGGSALGLALPNAAPNLGNLDGDSVSFLEGSSAVTLDAGTSATVNDADSADFAGGNVTVSIVGNRVGGEDVLAIQNQGTGAGQIGVSGSNVTYGGTIIGSFSGGTGNNDLLITLNANATPAAAQALVRNLTYLNSNGSDPTSSARTVRITVSDGDGGASNADVTVNVIGVNDAPTLSATGGTPTYTENGSAVDLFSGVSVSTIESTQTISGLSLTVNNLTDGSSEILRIDGTDIALTNGNSGTTASNGIGYSVSLAGSTATVTLNKVGGVSGAVAQGVVDGMSYRNSSETPTASTRTVTLTGITDNGGTANGGIDSTSLSIASSVTLVSVNDAPTVANAIANQNATEDAAFTFQFAANTFNDVDVGSTLIYNAQLAGGGALPVWLSFDPVTRTFSGTPLNAHVGSVSIDVIASDGNGGSVTDTFDIVVANSNDAPTVTNPILNQNATEDAAFYFQFAANTFNDIDVGDTLTYSVQLAGGGALPAWLSFDPVTRSFSGTPLNAHVGTLSIEVIADDGNGGSVSDTFDLVVANTNDAPTVVNPIADQSATEDAAFHFQFAANTFNDVDVGNTLTYSAQLAGGGALPAWLSFDPATRTFSGTPLNAHVGTLNFDVIASDGNGGSVTDTFSITVANSNDAPTVANPILNQNATEDAAFNFQFAANTFNDVDFGDTLTYSAQLAGGSALPAWLTFDPLTRTFSGTPGGADAGTLSIELVANDGNGGSVTDTFDIVVTEVNDAPVISAPLSIAVMEDEPGALTAISFADEDAGSAAVTVTFSVSSGTLSATSAGGVSVGGSSSVLTLTGSIADINTFISASGVRFTTASNATGNVTLGIVINDGGNTGSGGALTDSATLTLTVTAVNDAPVNSIPAAQSVDQDAALVFSSGNGNLISISDVDAAGSTPRVTLTASNGLITLAGTGGLNFFVGDGSNDGTMTFEGSIADINSALNGLTFSPTPGFNGAASLQITTDDLGWSGSGGAQTDTDTLNITVNSLNPRVVEVSALTADGTYKVGDTITITTTFTEAVLVDTSGGSPTLLLETGSSDRIATYVSGSGSNILTFSYTVQAGDISSDLNYQSTAALTLNGATIQSAVADSAVLTLPTLGGSDSLAGNKAIVIDGVAATVSSVSVPADGTYVAGDNLDFTVNLSESVVVDTGGGTPRIAVTLDTGGTLYAEYLSGSGSSALVFRLTLANGQMDSNGISLGGSIDANGATLRDAAGNDSVINLNAVGSTAGVLVDALAPEVSAISLDGPSPTDASSVTFTVTFSEDVSGVDLGDFSLITTGSVTATAQSLLQIDPRTYRITVDSITGLGSLGLNLNASGTGIVDSLGNAVTGAFTGQSYSIGITAVTPDVSGDPEFRANPPGAQPLPPSAPLQPTAPSLPPPPTQSPLIPQPLFEVPTLGSGLPPLGNIFINPNALAPSFIAQVFASSSDVGGDGSGSGFLGFGGGDAGVFGASSLSNLFGQEGMEEPEQLPIFDGANLGTATDANRVGGTVFGAPTLAQQLNELHENEQRQLRALASALEQIGNAGSQG